CADLVICLEVIEHVKNPFQADEEIRRVLKPSGKVLLTTPFIMPYHGKSIFKDNFSHVAYPDFWRFTHQGLEWLFDDFNSVEIMPFSNSYEFYANRIFKF